MRVTFAAAALLVGLFGVYLVGAGIFVYRPFEPDVWEVLLKPVAGADPLACFFLAVSVALGFFSLAIAAGRSSTGTWVQPEDVLLWGGLFSVLTAGGFLGLTYLLWQEGAGPRTLGLVFTLAGLQACIAVLLGGAATLFVPAARRKTVPIFVAGTVETVLAAAVLLVGAA